ncbi:MAG: [Fe-S]-binding protein [Chlamydiae bacterium]|nr:[Fe-S]-binding protein [Chlamydiota bacterium]
MNHKKTHSFPWVRYSKKLAQKIESPMHVGSYTQENASERGVRLVTGTSGSFDEGNFVTLFILVDEMDGVFADVKFQAYGQSALIGAADIACDILIRKNYDQAKRITADLIDKHVRDRKEVPAFPEETFAHLNMILAAIDEATDKCNGMPLAESYVAPPIAEFDPLNGEQRIYPGWDSLNSKQQISVIEEVIAQDIRPYIELDAGGIEVLNFLNNRELVIAYKGSCTSCHSATGATLSAIQQILRMKVHPEIVVTPDLSFLAPHLHSQET